MAGTTVLATGLRPNPTHTVSIQTTGITFVHAGVSILGLLTTVMDRMNEQMALFDELFEKGPHATALLMAEHRIVRVNEQFTRCFGFVLEEATGHELSRLLAVEEFSEPDGCEGGTTPDSMEVERVCRRKEDSLVHASLIQVPVSDTRGPIATDVIYRDSSERKPAERIVQEYVERLQTLSRRLLQVQEAERRHLARELHDEVGQMLTGLRLLLKANGNLSGDQVKTRFDRARAIVDDLLERVRGLSFDLRPAVLDQLGLVPALVALFERYTKQTGVLVHFKHQCVEQRFASELETAVYRVIQEALTNVARHARVAGATVRLWATPDSLNTQVEDRGCGFDAEAVLDTLGSHGLKGMRERVELLGGELTIESRPGAGTQLTAELPQPNEAGGEKNASVHRAG
jgi:PAS domain S-box-containing protein